MASFRGVEFSVRKHELEVGQRRVIADLPFDSKGAASTDLGRRSRRFKIDAILMGATRESRRDALITAVEAPGPGLLIHPVYGSLNVVVVPPTTIIESTEQGGLTEVTFECVESREKTARTPTIASEPVESRQDKSTTLRESSATQLEDTFTLDIPDWAFTAHIATVDEVLSDLRKLTNFVGAVLAIPSTAATQLDELSLSVSALLGTPRDLLDAINGVMETIFKDAGRVANAAGDNVDPSDLGAILVDARANGLRNLRLAISSAALLGQADTAQQDETASTNREALLQSTRANALSYVAQSAMAFPFETSPSARSVRDLLANAIESVAAGALTVELFDAMWSLRSTVLQTLSGVGLADVRVVTPSSVISSVELAYDLYEDTSRAGEIEARAEAEHPLFIPGAVAIEVLSE